ncbi:MAG TPA: anti-sigma factor [Casimicrobiaceae bacterium]|nr:anti-sigma factor [Casimicrobiaceae bacterium]
MNLSRPDRRERLDRLAAEFALGTSPPRVRRRLATIARRDRVVAASLSEWERRIAVLADRVPATTPPPRVWRNIETRLGLEADRVPAREAGWLRRIAFWRALAVGSLIGIVVLGAAEWRRAPVVVPAPLVVVLSGADAKVGLIATATRGERYLTLKKVGNAPPGQDKTLELWALPQAGAPQPLGVIPQGNVVRVPLQNPVDETLSNIPTLAVSVEPPGGSPTGKPTGPVVYSGAVERMY